MVLCKSSSRLRPLRPAWIAPVNAFEKIAELRCGYRHSRPAQAHFGAVVEIHVPGLARDLYGQRVEIDFSRRLRGHMPFPDAAAASAQIARDSAQALAVDAQDNP